MAVTITDRQAQAELDRLQDSLREAARNGGSVSLNDRQQALVLRGLVALQGERSYYERVTLTNAVARADREARASRLGAPR